MNVKERRVWMVTDQQVRRLRMLIKTQKTMAIASAKAGMDEKTARKYLKKDQLPSQCKSEHTWCTRSDPFDQEWEEIAYSHENDRQIPFKVTNNYLFKVALFFNLRFC